jgi:flagellar hook-length control protein FliK
MPELSAFLSTGTVYGDGDVVTTGASEPHTAQGHQPAPTVVEPGVQAPNGQQPVATGRNFSEPIVSKAGVNVIGGQPVGETGTGKEPAALASLLHVKLTEELSRSVLDQVFKHMSLQTRGEASEMRMRLDPPSLGEVRVTVRVEEGRMHAQIEVSQPSVKVVLETNMPQLRQSLSDSGIEVRRIDVCTSGSSMSRESHEGNGDRQKRRDNGRNQISVDGVEQYRAARMMGYNTMEMIM